jgi:2,3-bisphosphoglycerate-independent phosphoglycerate mutase
LIDRTISQLLANSGVSQYAMSETQKFGHVTYFWNGNRSGKFNDRTETYEEIPSDKVPFEQRPWMKAAEITDRTLEVVRGGAHRFVRINFANGDMVGHSGDLDATVVAVEAVDLCLARLCAAIDRVNGTLVVLADHGNADDMIERDGNGRPKFYKDNSPVRRTSHSLNPVPFIVYRPQERLGLRQDLESAGLSNVAASVLELLGFKPPAGYEASLLT